MNAFDALNSLGELDLLEPISRMWEESEKALPPEGQPLLSTTTVTSWREYCGLDAAADKDLSEVIDRLKSDPVLARLAWHIYWRNFISPDPGLGKLPDMRNSLGDLCGCFYLLLALGIVPPLRRHHAALNLPEKLTRDTAQQVSCFSGNYKRGANGKTGLYLNQFPWLRNYVKNIYLRIGRFEYWPKPYAGGVVACRRRKDGMIQAFAEAGLNFAADGFALGAETPPERTAFRSELRIDDETIEGNPVSRDGRAGKEALRLSLAEWEITLSKGTQILDMHIPAGGGMDPETCHDSLKNAKELFQRHFPDLKPAAVTCASWIFNPNLPEILPPNSNLIAFERDVRLYPISSNPTDGLWFIFLQDKFDPSTAPRGTSLQKAILDFIGRGGRWRCGGMFLPIEEIDDLGE